jgi:hypothetical protein
MARKLLEFYTSLGTTHLEPFLQFLGRRGKGFAPPDRQDELYLYLRETSPEVSHRISERELDCLHFSVKWAYLGLPVFQLTHSAAAAFVLTELGNLKMSDLNLPFDCFMIQLPYPNGPLTVGDDSGEKPIDAQYVIVHKTEIAVAAEDGEAGDTIRANFHPVVNMTVCSASEEGGQRHILVDKDETLEHLLQRTSNTGAPVSRLDLRATNGGVRLLASFLLWLHEQKAGGQWPGKRGLPSRVSRPGTAKVWRWELGKEIKLGEDLRKAARDYGSQAHDNGTAWKLKARFVVRGHWRDQPHGPQRSLRKRIWIEPHWKGDDRGAVLTRLYTTP